MKHKKILDVIDSPDDLKKISENELSDLSKDVSSLIKSTVEKKGGHYSSPLGVVDLTIALHYVYNTPHDKIIWDVGHQAYSHKILTGRKMNFHTIRQSGGLSGFLKRTESIYDCYGAGHSSTSISAALGFAHARDLKGDNNKVIAIIGDGAITNGLSYEAINNVGIHKTQLTIILNDNSKSISDSVGALSKYLARLITNPTYNQTRKKVWKILDNIPLLKNFGKKILRKTEESLKTFLTPGGLFEEMGLRYIGPVDGHDIKGMIKLFKNIRNINTPILVHVVTKKGKNSESAENDSIKYYSLSGSENELKKEIISYSKAFGEIVTSAAEKNDNFACITAAMDIGTGLSSFKKKFPKRLFDVGIAEGHAVTFASGLSCEGILPVIALYSTFSQRAYDNFIHDLLLQDLPFILCLDRGGIVGADGPTHHGVLDISMFLSMPNIIIAAPKDGNELRDLFHTALNSKKGFVIRYPKGDCIDYQSDKSPRMISVGAWEILKKGKKCAIIAVGSMVDMVLKNYTKISKEIGYNPCIVNARFIKPIDKKIISEIYSNFEQIITIEEGAQIGGFGSFILNDANLASYTGKIKVMAINDDFVDQGNRSDLLKICGLSVEKLIKEIKK
tara:strand:+ start:3121 stop:4974 length:1854 start_codon:yes stop_codon:yes gene_type:complete